MYWGLYGLVERPDETFASEHFGGDKDDYDVLKGVRFGETTQAMLTNGGRDVWDAMFALADQDMTNPANYAAMQQYVDIDQLIDYNIGIIYTGDRDGPTGIVAGQSTPKNFYGVRHRSPEGRFRFYPWDADFTFEDVNADVSEREGTQNPARLHFKLRANAEYRLKFADHVRKWFFNDGPLTPGPVAEQFLLRAQEIDQAVVAESARWGDSKREPPYTRDVEWVAERNRVVNSYIPARSGVVLNQFIADGLYPAVAAPDYTVDGRAQHGGPVQTTDAIGITAPTGTIYYTTDGSDPRTGPPTVTTTTLVAENAPVRARVPTDGSLAATWQQTGFTDTAWLSGNGGVGYDRGTGFSGLIGLDLLSAMPESARIDTNGDGVNENNSVYTRYAFNVSDPADFDSLTLNMRYDDGFVAYLNGHEVARANAPTSAAVQFGRHARSRRFGRGDDGHRLRLEQPDYDLPQRPGLRHRREHVAGHVANLSGRRLRRAFRAAALRPCRTGRKRRRGRRVPRPDRSTRRDFTRPPSPRRRSSRCSAPARWSATPRRRPTPTCGICGPSTPARTTRSARPTARPMAARR